MHSGSYIGSVAGTDTELATGKPDNPALIKSALEVLKKESKRLITRGYIQYLGNGRLAFEAPENIDHEHSSVRASQSQGYRHI